MKHSRTPTLQFVFVLSLLLTLFMASSHSSSGTSLTGSIPEINSQEPFLRDLLFLQPNACEAAGGYIIRTGDTLWDISQRVGLEYSAIVQRTNQQCATNPAFTCINDPRAIAVGSCIDIGATQPLPTAPTPLPTPPQPPLLATAAPLSPTVSPELPAQELPALELPACEVAGLAANKIVIAGSSTVEPLSRQIAGIFRTLGFAGPIEISRAGTGAGFQQFCETDVVDIVDASRPIKTDELTACRLNAKDPLAFAVGLDALPIMVSRNNTFVDVLTLDEVKLVFSTARRWSDIRSEWPAELIKRVIPDDQSGTFDFFVEHLFANDPEPLLTASNKVTSADDEDLARVIQADPYAIGFFGYAIYQQHAAALRLVELALADGSTVAPSAETVNSGAYPLLRQLFLYSAPATLCTKPEVAMFLSCYLRNVNTEIGQVGYFPLESALFQQTLDTFKNSRMQCGAPTNKIAITGSSTVEPLTKRLAERFKAQGFAGDILIDGPGTGAGFTLFCAEGMDDIVDASRAIKASERAQCQTMGREPVELLVGLDALPIVVSAANTFVEDVTLEELQLIFTDDNFAPRKWSDIRIGWPEEPIKRVIPDQQSGTFDFFVDTILRGDANMLLAAQNKLASADDQVLATAIQADPLAIGFFGFAIYKANQAGLKLVNLRTEGAEVVTPRMETVNNNSYPLVRPLFLYTDAKTICESSDVADFLNFYLAHVNEEISAVGYFPLTESSFQRTINELAATQRRCEPISSVFSELPAQEIIVSGSSTVEPLTAHMAELFKNQGYPGDFFIDGPGTGAGFRLFCTDGSEALVGASRPVTPEEKARCQNSGRELIELPVGLDALPVVVGLQNTFVDTLTIQEVKLIFSDKGVEGRRWADIRPGWPDEPIKRVIPDRDSGTFDFFVEKVFDGDPTLLQNAKNKFAAADDQALANVIQSDPYSIGFFGYAIYQNNQTVLRAVGLETESGVAMEPSGETVNNNSYPLLRPLYLYTTPTLLCARRELEAFVHFYLDNVNQEIERVGYFRLAPAALQVAFDNFSAVTCN